MKPLMVLAALVVTLLPFAAQAQGDSRNTVYVEVPTTRGTTKVALVRKGEGFVGPRGEYYPTFPTKKTLTAVYGSSAAPTPTATPKGKSSSGGMSGTFTVKTFTGGVKIHRDGKLYREIRTKYPDIRGWKLIRDNAAIVVKSGVGREPGYVEMFDVKSGSRLDKIKATEIKDGKPTWAKNFAE